MEWKEFSAEVGELVDNLAFYENQLVKIDDFDNALKAKKEEDSWRDFECKFLDMNAGHYQSIFFSRNTLELLIAEEKAQAKENIHITEQKLATLTQTKAFERFKGQDGAPGTDSDGGVKGPQGNPLRIKVSDVFPKGEEE